MSTRKTKQSGSNAGGSSDINIPVMGATGAGKSTFINQVLGREIRTVGHTIDSCTSKISMEHVDPSKLPRTRLNLFTGRKVYLVDTQGFDDTFKDDGDILQKITKWLKESYGKRTSMESRTGLLNIWLCRMMAGYC
ncbi:hypothetical protein CVT25_012490 [Psilocybe cyanescens]|uniref:G domain-containing protein n=1 Tax=Psilocybe cyanescens TaxID=93625 RepID=A0A409XFQ5_PSICY|nr:hypothetical protein CVT25_012490 [Psilocybe cyanescens]